MLLYILAILASLLLTTLIAIPYIKLLFKFNIRRPPKVKLDDILPGNSVKLGTPIMGGTVIILTIIILLTIFLRNWEYYWMVVLICFIGGFLGFVDEYTNTLGRTFMAVRKSRSTKTKTASLAPTKGMLGSIKKVLLIPWKAFEEVLRIMGGEQKGLKNHYKFLMYFLLTAIVIYFFVQNSVPTVFYLPYLGSIELGTLYYVMVAFLLIGYAVAFGITDGLDGMSAGTHAIAFLAYGILAAYFGLPQLALLALIIVGAELAFLYFNIKPARMEMSDVGTLPLGMLFVVIALLLNREITLPFIGAIFTIEILSSVSQQWSVKLTGKRIFLVAPIHHHFQKLGWEENKVVERFWLFAVIFAMVGLVLALI